MTVKKREFQKGIRLRPDADALENIEGELKVDSGDNKAKMTLGAAPRSLVTEDQTQDLTNKTINADNNTIQNLRDAELAADADITRTKLAPGTADHVLINDGSGELSSEEFLSKARGGTGADNSSVTFPSTGTLATLAGAETLTNKTIDAASNTISNLDTTMLAAGVLDTDLNAVSASDDTIPSAKATKDYVDAQVGAVSGDSVKVSANDTTAGFLNGKLVAGTNITFTENNDGGNETLTIDAAGGAGETNTASNVGTGDDVFKQKTGTDLEFRTIVEGPNFFSTENTDDLTFSVLSATRSITTTGNILATDTTVRIDASSGAVTATLPDATTNSGKIFAIKATDVTNTVTIDTAAGNIDGSASVTLDNQYDSIIVQSNGTNYDLLANVGNTGGGGGTPPGSSNGIGFYAGGNNAGGTVVVAQTVKIDASVATPTVAAIGATLSAARAQVTGGSSGDDSLVMGGFESGSILVTTIESFDRGLETYSAYGANLPAVRVGGAGRGNSTDVYYFGGADTLAASAEQSTIYKANIAVPGVTTLGASLTSARTDISQCMGPTTKAYIGAGIQSSGTTVNEFAEFDYATESYTGLGALSTFRSGCHATTGSSTSVWHSGFTNAFAIHVNAVEIDHSTNSQTLIGNLPQGSVFGNGISSSTGGALSGGTTNGSENTFDTNLIEFDSTTPSWSNTGNTLPQNNRRSAAMEGEG